MTEDQPPVTMTTFLIDAATKQRVGSIREATGLTTMAAVLRSAVEHLHDSVSSTSNNPGGDHDNDISTEA